MEQESVRSAYKDAYKYYYEKIQDDARRSARSNRKIVLGYTSDLDVIVEWDDAVFSSLCAAYLNGVHPLSDNVVIDSIPSLAHVVSNYLIKGLGGEIDIVDNAVCEYLEKNFKLSHELGGTCAQGAAALSTIGFPVLVHITDKSKDVSRLMDRPGVCVVSGNEAVPIFSGRSAEIPVRHIILQYPKGSRIKICDRYFEAPSSNRLILDYDKIHKSLPIDRNFLEYCESCADDISVYSISGFNGILDAGIIEERTDDLAAHYRRVKAKNPDCLIYLEDAHYLNFDLKEIVFGKFAKLIDFFGMNEEELIDHAQRLGVSIDPEDFESVIEGLKALTEHYSIRGIVLHTKDYSLYYGNKVKGVDIVKGLTLGNLLAGTRARLGRYGSYEDCKDTLILPISRRGVSFHERLGRIRSEKSVFLVPTRYIEKPRYTIGLGDTFMGGFLISLADRQ